MWYPLPECAGKIAEGFRLEGPEKIARNQKPPTPRIFWNSDFEIFSPKPAPEPPRLHPQNSFHVKFWKWLTKGVASWVDCVQSNVHAPGSLDNNIEYN